MTNEELVKQVQLGKNKEKHLQKLYEQNRGIINKIINKYAANYELEDLMQEAFIALIKAVNNFDEGVGVKFVSYFCNALKRHIQRYCAECLAPIKLSANMDILIRQYQSLVRAYESRYNREPTDEQCKASLNITDKELKQIKEILCNSNIAYLDTPIEDVDGLTLIDTIKDPVDEIEDIDNKKENEYIRQRLKASINRLKASEALVIDNYYFKNKTCSEIADEIAVQPSKIYAIKTSAIRNLQRDATLLEFKPKVYDSRKAYHYGLQEFKNSWLSSTEYIAFKNFERSYKEKKCL